MQRCMDEEREWPQLAEQFVHRTRKRENRTKLKTFSRFRQLRPKLNLRSPLGGLLEFRFDGVGHLPSEGGLQGPPPPQPTAERQGRASAEGLKLAERCYAFKAERVRLMTSRRPRERAIANSDKLRGRALWCRRFATGTADPIFVARLKMISDEYERTAQEIEGNDHPEARRAALIKALSILNLPDN